MNSVYVEFAPGDSLSWEVPTRPAPEPTTNDTPKTGAAKTETLSFKLDETEGTITKLTTHPMRR